jgi:uncharacterized phage-associated protein
MSKPKQFELEKTIQALNFFLNKEPSKTMDKMKLLKLLWLADRYTLRNYGYSITGDDYYAMEYGSIGTTTKDILDKKKINGYIDEFIEVLSKTNIRSKEITKFDEFSETDLSTLKMVWSVYGTWSSAELSLYSHKFPEWLRYKKQIEKNHSSYKESLEDFFDNPKTRPHRYIYNEDEETLETSKEWLEKNSKLQAVFT